jgi:hypothetical protein
MAGTKSRYTRLLVGTDGAGAAWDFSSESNKLGVKLSGEKLDDTTFQSSGRTAVAGDPEGSITQSGYWTSPAAGTFDGEMVDAIKNAESLYVAALFGDNVSKLWIEPPFSPAGLAREVWHYRLFCDAAWQPLVPRGEVYSKDWTPADWKSWSDIHGEPA